MSPCTSVDCHRKAVIFLLRLHIPLCERLLVSEPPPPPPPPSSSSAFSLSQSHLFQLYAALLFPRQQRQRTSPRRIQPMAAAVVWVVVLLGSVELAASVCMLWVYAHMWVELWGGGSSVCTHSCIHMPHALMHRPDCASEGQSCPRQDARLGFHANSESSI